ncbi:hypothetical protein HC928_24435, partial [bacterium]|nr:hypothetical protein [bacterium]
FTLQLAQVYGDRGLAKAMFSAPDRSLRSLPPDATADFNRALQLNPKDERTYYNRGCMRHRWGDNTGAIADFSQAIALEPRHAFAYMQRGILRGLGGDTPGAIADLRQAMTYLCNSGDATACQQARALMQQLRGVGSTIS